jgi:hypothetical protein
MVRGCRPKRLNVLICCRVNKVWVVLRNEILVQGYPRSSLDWLGDLSLLIGKLLVHLCAIFTQGGLQVGFQVQGSQDPTPLQTPNPYSNPSKSPELSN